MINRYINKLSFNKYTMISIKLHKSIVRVIIFVSSSLAAIIKDKMFKN